MKSVIVSAFILMTLGLGADSIAGPAPSMIDSTPIKLSLKQAIDLALKQNLDFMQTKLQLDQDTITYNTAWRTFFLPQINLIASNNSALTLGGYPGTPAASLTSGTRNTGYPTSEIGITLGNYTLFNFFRDRITFDLAKLQYERANQLFEENKRNFVSGVISSYFQARLNQEKYEAAERSLQIADLILKLLKSRLALHRAEQTEIDSAEVDRNDATIQARDLKNTLYTSLLNLNELLYQSPETKLILTTELEYKPLRMSFEEAFSLYKERAPTIRTARLQVEQGQGAVEIAEKNRLPLPSVTFSGVTVAYTNAYAGVGNNYGPTNGQIDVQASIGFTLPILGPGGLFNGDQVKSSRILLDRSELGLKRAIIDGEVQIRTAFGDLKQLQERLKPLKESFETSAKVLDRIVSEMSNKKENRLELRDALNSARNNEIALLENVFAYISRKNDLYRIIGRDLEIE